MISLVASIVGYLALCAAAAVVGSIIGIAIHDRAIRWWQERRANAPHRRAVREFIAEERQRKVSR